MWDYEHWKKDPLSQKALARIAELELALRGVLHEWKPQPDEYVDGGASYQLAKAAHERAVAVLAKATKGGTMPRAQDDARLVAAQIINLLRDHWQNVPNERTDSALTSFRRNAIGPGMFEAIDLIAKEYQLDLSESNRVAIREN